jgi:ketol-acid reductoisomerase
VRRFTEQEYFDNGVLMIAMVKAGVELAFETMTQTGIIEVGLLRITS